MTQQVTGATYQLKLEYPVVLSKHLHQAITNITFGETVEAVNWILGDEAIRNALSEKLGPEYVDTLQGWVPAPVAAFIDETGLYRPRRDASL